MTIAILVLSIIGFLFLLNAFPTKERILKDNGVKILELMTGGLAVGILLFLAVVILAIISVVIKGP